MSFQVFWVLIVSLFCFSKISQITFAEDLWYQRAKFLKLLPESEAGAAALQQAERGLIKQIKGLCFWTFVLFLPFFFI